MATQTRYISTADCAKLVRGALKKSWPAVKFSVTSKSYSGGSSIRVRYMDGPASEDVENVVNEFCGASFDGSIDLKSYHDSTLNGERVHFSADYIFVEHQWSEVEKQRIEALCDRKYADWREHYYYWFNQVANEDARKK